MNKLILIALFTSLIIGCNTRLPSNTNIDGTYLPDLDYFINTIAANTPMSEKRIQAYKQSHIDRDFKYKINNNQMTITYKKKNKLVEDVFKLERINDELFIRIQTEKNNRFIQPYYFDKSDNCIYGSSQRLILKR